MDNTGNASTAAPSQPSLPSDASLDNESDTNASETTSTPSHSSGEAVHKGPPEACLFVASLSNDTTEQSLQQHFSKFGNVLSVKLMKDKLGRAYSFVQFELGASADLALTNQSHTVDNRKLRVERAKVNRTLFLAKIPKTTTNQELRAISEEYGPVENVTVIKNHQTNKSKGCAFIKFSFREDAIEAMAGIKSKYKKWVVEWATSANDPDVLGVDKQSIFVGGLNAKQVTKAMVEKRFSIFGLLESVTLINPINPSSSDSSEQSSPYLGEEKDLVAEDSSATSLDAGSKSLQTSGSDHPDSDNEVEKEITSDNGEKRDQSTEEDDDSPSGSSASPTTNERSAFAFLRFLKPQSAAAAIEAENGNSWMDKVLRVQYCETQQMKERKRMTKIGGGGVGMARPMPPTGPVYYPPAYYPGMVPYPFYDMYQMNWPPVGGENWMPPQAGGYPGPYPTIPAGMPPTNGYPPYLGGYW